MYVVFRVRPIIEWFTNSTRTIHTSHTIRKLYFFFIIITNYLLILKGENRYLKKSFKKPHEKKFNRKIYIHFFKHEFSELRLLFCNVNDIIFLSIYFSSRLPDTLFYTTRKKNHISHILSFSVFLFWEEQKKKNK